MSKTITLAVTGMKCGGCESNVSNKLHTVEGVIEVQASSKEAQVTIEYDDSTDEQIIKQAIVDAGYTVA